MSGASDVRSSICSDTSPHEAELSDDVCAISALAPPYRAFEAVRECEHERDLCRPPLRFCTWRWSLLGENAASTLAGAVEIPGEDPCGSTRVAYTAASPSRPSIRWRRHWHGRGDALPCATRRGRVVTPRWRNLYKRRSLARDVLPRRLRQERDVSSVLTNGPPEA